MTTPVTNDTPFDSASVRKFVMEAVPCWIERGNPLEEWKGALSHPKTAPALEELVGSEELFVGFFLDLLTAVGIEGSTAELTRWSQGEDLEDRPDDLAVYRKMAAMLFNKFG